MVWNERGEDGLSASILSIICLEISSERIIEARELSLNTSLIDETKEAESLNGSGIGKRDNQMGLESDCIYGIQEAGAHLKTTLKRNQACRATGYGFKTEFEQLNKENRTKTKEECIMEFKEEMSQRHSSVKQFQRTLPYCPTGLFELVKVKLIHNQWNCALSHEATVHMTDSQRIGYHYLSNLKFDSTVDVVGGIFEKF
ncbi:hypothetical protein BY996DRAFT_8392854 [Phakopsora pachyrhizi]|nr:hypothetical protein BY996DRAFT_8392854 [Phakopsora pachyrhizi]